MPADLVLTNGAITTMDERRPSAECLAIQGERIVAIGTPDEVAKWLGPNTRTLDVGGRRIIPGLNDSHLHLVRAGLYYALELRWEHVKSLSKALDLLRAQARRTPPGHWVRVVGGWSEFQFEERRMPTLQEINEATGDTPAFVLHLYHCVLLNRAAVRAAGFTKDTPDPPGARIERDAKGEPTGWLVATPNANLLYSTLAKAPKLDAEAGAQSSRQFMREMNRLGVTSCGDAGGGSQRFPEDYAVIQKLQRDGELTVRIAYSLFTQRPGKEVEDFDTWIKTTKPGQGDDWLRHNGAGEMLVYSAADFENFLEPRPDLALRMESELEAVLSRLVAARWPFRLHATYDESISRFLNVLEGINGKTPLNGLRWWLDHCETISEQNIARVKALGGGIAIQHRLAYQGEHFNDRYPQVAPHAPPFAAIRATGMPASLGTDATRVASYNPWIALHWASTGKTVGGAAHRKGGERLTREEALAWMTRQAAWFTGDDDRKGMLREGLLADVAVLDQDYFSVPDDKVPQIQSLLTIAGGKIVHAVDPWNDLAPSIPVMK
ncbi:MAG TPA: amidohydrolase, partial [Candidatus Thermoplasmatota archaeon]|nr:amidohydrolase [Candidatus Thermoplasmatota archaeon]